MTTKTQKLLELETLGHAAECLKTMAHPHRLRMVQMLLRGEYPVGELAKSCGIAPHVASGHLTKMKDRGLLKSQRRMREVYYEIAEPGLASIMGCIEKRFGDEG